MCDYFLDLKYLSNIERDTIVEFVIDKYNSLLRGEYVGSSQNCIFELLIRSGFLKSIKQEDRENKIKEIVE